MFVFREGVIHFLIMILITWLLMHTVPRKRQPWTIFIFALSYSSFWLILDVIYRYRSPEIGYTYYIVILCNKLSTLGFCYKDETKDSSHLDKHGMRWKIDKVPSIYELISFSCYPGGCIVGPYFEFKDYINFIEHKEQYSNIPLSLVKGLLKYVLAVWWMGIAVFICQYVYIDFFISDEYNQTPFLIKLVYSYMNLIQFKYKGYSIWCFADGANILSGLSYSGNDEKGNPRYEAMVSIRILGVEFGRSPRDIIGAWNHQTARWLKYYVYERVKRHRKENEEKAAFVTFMVSAFWHGFYPGYYLFFIWVHLILAISKKVYKFRDYFNWMPDIMKWILSNLFFWFFVGQVGTLHINLQLKHAWNVLTNTYFIGVAPIIVMYLLWWIIPNPKSHHHKVIF